MDVYIFKASLYCEDCGLDIKKRLDAEGKAPEDADDEYSFDSDEYPKGPYGDGGGEADSPQHCDGCGCFLENSLTSEGFSGVCDTIVESLSNGRTECTKEWADFYDISLKDLFEHAENMESSTSGDA